MTADKAELLRATEPNSTRARLDTQKDVVSLTRSASDTSLFTSGSRLEASSQVGMHEKHALRGTAAQQYSFHFDSADSARVRPSLGTPKSDSSGKTSKQVTKKEKKALLNSSINQYNLTLYG